MSDRRPSRTKKKVDYSSYATEDDDFADDDDFASFTPPVSSKPKKAAKQKKEKRKSEVKQQVVEIHTEPVKRSVNRKPVDERQFERELELALELSKTESQVEADDDKPVTESVEDIVTAVKEDCTETAKEDNNRQLITDMVTVKEDSIETGKEDNNRQLITDSSDIEILQEYIADKPTGRSAPRKRVFQDESDDELNSEGSEDEFDVQDEVPSDSESDFDPDCDSDFEGGSKSKKKGAKTKKNNVITTKKTTTASNKTPGKSTKKTSAVSATLTSTPKPSMVPSKKPVAVSKSPASSLHQPNKKIGLSQAISPVITNKKSTLTPKSNNSRSPLTGIQVTKTPLNRSTTNNISKSPGSTLTGQFKSPGLGGSAKSGLGGVNVKSPGSSAGLRLGLSRNIRLKPLHPGINLTPR